MHDLTDICQIRCPPGIPIDIFHLKPVTAIECHLLMLFRNRFPENAGYLVFPGQQFRKKGLAHKSGGSCQQDIHESRPMKFSHFSSIPSVIIFGYV
jgi:hypothetical protein